MELGSEQHPRPPMVPPGGKERSEKNEICAAQTSLVEEIHEDIKATLRVSIVNLPFSLWSNHPPLLELLWNRLRPNLQTRYVESAADRIREKAVRTISARFGLREIKKLEESEFSGPTVQLRRFLVDIHHYANPKLLIATAGLLEASQGHVFEPVKDRELCMSVPPGMPAAMPKLALNESLMAKPQDATLLKEIQDTLALPLLSSDYVCLSSLCGYLDKVWTELKQIIKTDTYWQLAEDLASLAALLARGLPYPISLGREDFKSIGMSVLEATNWIIPSHMALTKLILNMAALKVGLDGKEEALRSPYPISSLSRISRGVDVR